jgi:uncharacterized membrane protein
MGMQIWLFLHVLGAVLFLGNIVTAAFWKAMADRTDNPEVIRYAAKNVMLADWVFTLPGLVLIIVSGSLMAASGGLLSGWNWLTLSLLLFAVTGVIWLAVLLPLQRKMIRLSAANAAAGSVNDAYRRASRHWNTIGLIATLLPVVILYLMIGKQF